MSSLCVVKVGGSLFDLPDLGDRLTRWLAQTGLSTVLFVPGGGPTADFVRDLDRRYRLGEEVAHWLALHTLTLNAYMLAALVPDCEVVPDANAAPDNRRAILDCFAFALDDEKRPDHLPHLWTVTSDSIAARTAKLAQAKRLYLLKSVTLPHAAAWTESARRGFVDPYFPLAAQDLEVIAVNLRGEPDL